MDEPTSTTMGRRWRWDRFATNAAAGEWHAKRKAEGHRVFLRGLSVAWDQAVAPRAARPQYPKQRLSWCGHCGERRTFLRAGPGGADPRPAYRKAGFKQYTYTETPRHTCPGLEKEAATMATTARDMMALVNRMLAGR